MEAKRRIFDAHFHVFDLEVRSNFPNQNVSMGWPSEKQAKIHRDHTVKEAEEAMATAGVKEAVFVQVFNDCPEEVDWVLDQSQGKEFVRGIVGGLDPSILDKLEENIKKFITNKTPKFVGIRHLIKLDHVDYLTRDDVIQGLQLAADYGLTFDLQDAYPIPHIPQLAQRVPKLKMVIDHLAKPPYLKPEEFSDWCKYMSEAAKYPNVYCKLSGMINEIPDWSVEKFQPYVDHCLREFGVARCFFGSDWPVSKCSIPDATYKDLVELLEGLLGSLTEEEKDDIFYNNAKKFYNID